MKARRPRLEKLKAAKLPGHRTRLRQLPGATEPAAPDPEPIFEEPDDAMQELDTSIRRDFPSERE
jgi:hypothetical protein